MGQGNMFDNVFEKLVSEPVAEPEKASERPAQSEQPSETAKADGLFTLKNVPAAERKPTTIIFSKRNYIRLKTQALNADLTMSEYVNRWLEGMQAEG